MGDEVVLVDVFPAAAATFSGDSSFTSDSHSSSDDDTCTQSSLTPSTPRAPKLSDRQRRSTANSPRTTRASPKLSRLRNSQNSGIVDKPASSVSASQLNFTDAQLIGTGSQANIYQMTFEGRQVAVKVSASSSVLDEVTLVAKFNHPNIICAIGSAMVPSERLPAGGHEAITVAGGDCEPAQFYAAIYEYAGQKDLKSFLKQREYWRGDVVCMSRVFDDILAGLEYLHSWSLLHCDIKPDNILVDNLGCCKLADFGLCQPVSEGMVIQGTPSFLSPEFIIEWFHGNKHAKFSQAADIFSFGVTMVYCLTGRYPFKRITAKLKSGKKMNMSAIYKHFGPPDDMLMRVASLDRRFIKMVRMCFKFRPEERPTATQLRAILREH